MPKFIKICLFIIFLFVPDGDRQHGVAGVVTTGETAEGKVSGPASDREGNRGPKISQGSPSMEGDLQKLPIYIDSKEMTVKGQEGRVLFRGAVKIQHGDVIMKADQAEVFLSDMGSEASNGSAPPLMNGKRITKIEVERNVELMQGRRKVSAQRGTYDAFRQELVFSGEPEMWEDGYNVKGKVIILSLAEKRSIIEGSRLTVN